MLIFVRVAVASIASTLDMVIDDIDDLQLAVEEMCIQLITSVDEPNRRLSLILNWNEVQIEVRCSMNNQTTSLARKSQALPDSISQQIVRALVDEFGQSFENDREILWLRKSRGRERRNS